ncbi:hypothetical protein PACILC2_22330 [Paenibacillus cisolokensis]|uniref:Uncharacterized protein n=1 Tax=Paenibacillus cisolokensis TaxID=1658519 RepID=A0ABQ4N683_9BACL|nr:hypothetical protein [Paenibacillus cisolokensis]GIQ63665.1 hypothetical protein PACILC2_22330 [Paenibacillus cisolokensis]
MKYVMAVDIHVRDVIEGDDAEKYEALTETQRAERIDEVKAEVMRMMRNETGENAEITVDIRIEEAAAG